MSRFLATAFAFAAVLSMAAFAADAPSVQTPPALNAPLKGGLIVFAKGEGPSGLTGWLMKDKSGTYYTFFTTPDGKYLFAGALLDENGNNLTQKFQDMYEPKADLSTLFGKLNATAHITTGAKLSKGEIYVFIDPNCPYCHLFWVALRPYEAAGLKVHWIEVGFLHEDSAAKAAALLTADDQPAALARSQENFDSGGITPLATIPADTATKLKDNLALMHAFQIAGTPGIVFKDAKGTIHTKQGMPKLQDLPAMTGLPEQPAPSDPAFDRFK